MATFKVGRSGLRFRQKCDSESGTDQPRGQLEFRQGGFLHTGIVMGETMKKSPESKMARVIGTVSMQQIPMLIEMAGKPLL